MREIILKGKIVYLKRLRIDKNGATQREIMIVLGKLMYPKDLSKMSSITQKELEKVNHVNSILYTFNYKKLEEVTSNVLSLGLIFLIFLVSQKEKLLNSNSTFI